jgi:diguanylate cyclase (GGDEF)-like protein
VAGSLGAILSLTAWIAVWHREADLAELELKTRADSYRLALQFGIDSYLSKVAGLRALFDASKSVNREEFETFSEQALNDQTALRGMAWIPRVAAQDRDIHERAGVLDGLVGYQIRAAAPDGSLVASSNYDEYFPLFFAVRQSRDVRGLNFKDGGARQQTLERARDTGQMATSPTFTFIKGTGDRSGFFVVLPVYRPGAAHDTVEDRRKNLIGFVHAAFQTNVLLDAIIGTVTRAGGLDLYFFSGKDGRAAPVYYYDASARTHAVRPESRDVLVAGPHWTGELRIGDTTWTLLAVPVPNGPAAASHSGSWIVLTSGLLLSVALMAYIWGTAQHAQRLQAANMKLDQNNLRTDAAINNMPQGLLMFDSVGRLIVCNDRYLEIYGLSREMFPSDCSFIDLLRYQAAKGVTSINPDQLEATITELSRGETIKDIVATTDGREIFITQRPMDGGGWIATHEDVTERRRTEAKISHMAMYDGLTDLPNRSLFSQQIANKFALLDRSDKFAVLCLDLDHFKEVNDTFGHPFGDRLLEQVGVRLRDCLRQPDIVARLAGDEFAISPADTIDHAEIASLAARIVNTIGTAFELDGHEVVIGVSIGIAVAPTDATDTVDLLRVADLALYQAKADGRGTYRFFELEMDQRMRSRRALEVDLRRALANHEFVLHYQPLVNLKNGKITGFEALIRWNHPVRGELQPAEFIPFAEESTLIIRIGEWILYAACAQASEWPAEIRVAVNLSSMQFRTQTLYHTIHSALARSNLAANRLELEITESVLLVNQPSTLETLRQLRTLGVRITMDDFGTGHSSLSYLRCFPFDRIKIDCSFVHDLSSKKDSRAIIRAVAVLASSLGMETTAEGIETQGELDYVKRVGCTEGQGYFFGKAQPAEDVRVLIASGEAGSKAAG